MNGESRKEIFSSENITMNKLQGVKLEMSKSKLLFCVDERCGKIQLKENTPVAILFETSTKYKRKTFSLELSSPSAVSTEFSFLAHEFPYSANSEMIQRICLES
nr:uncharacterized protein LOC122268856 [Parasteatoda tepidariorum]